MTVDLKISKRAILTGMAVFFMTTGFSPTCRAQSKKKTGETYKDLISKAHNLVLQKDRQQAQMILSSALKAEKPGSKAHLEIKKTLSEISQVFLSDKAQQLYELSLSLKRNDLSQAQQRLNEALRIEGDNITLLAESARQSLIRNECGGAEEIVARAQKLNPTDDEIMLIQAQTQVCLNDLAGFQKTHDSANLAAFSSTWTNLEIEKSIKEKNYVKAKEGLNLLKKTDKAYPEIAYWEWKIDNELKANNLDAAQKYMMDCRNLTVHTARRLNADPWLCRRTAETDAYLKAQGQSQ